MHAALEEAMKKSSKHHITNIGPIHGSFPPQGGMQPSFQGSQSMSPGQSGGQAPMGMPPGMPTQGEDPNAFQ